MTGTYKAIASNKKAVKALESVRKSLIARKIQFDETEQMVTLPAIPVRYGKSESRNELCIVITAQGEASQPKARKVSKPDLYTYHGPSETPYELTDEELAFFAETEALPLSPLEQDFRNSRISAVAA